MYDLIGIGSGPMNLALAIAIQEKASNDGRFAKTHFFEQRKEFSWHPGMMISGATVQLSYLKDLVTLRNPCSAFSFLNFLKSQGRLEHFVNLKEWYPSRLEFNQYFKWVATLLGDNISYGCRAAGVSIAHVEGEAAFAVTVNDNDGGQSRTVYARNLSLACGGTPYLPRFVLPHRDTSSVCHSSTFLTSVRPLLASPDKPYQFAVVGRGQSAAEITTYLLENFPNGSVTIIMQGYSFMAADDNPFMNEIFFSAGVDLFNAASGEVRAELHDECRSTNYSVADADLLAQLYKLSYADRVLGKSRLTIRNLANAVGFDTSDGRSITQVYDKREQKNSFLSADLTVFATGYARTEASSLLSGLRPFLCLTDGGHLKVDRFCRVETEGLDDLQIFVQGETEDVHGISSTLLSVLPFRSGEIADLVRDSMTQRRHRSYHAAA